MTAELSRRRGGLDLLAVALSSATFLAGALTGYGLARRPAALPSDLESLPARLARNGLPLWVVADKTGSLYLTEEPRSPREVQGLRANVEHAAEWKGCVHVWPHARGTDVATGGWGEHGFVRGDVVFFGDPALLRKVHAALR
jgi:hypothetical protein